MAPRVISAKKAFHASTDDAGAAEMYANQLSISLCAFISAAPGHDVVLKEAFGFRIVAIHAASLSTPAFLSASGASAPAPPTTTRIFTILGHSIKLFYIVTKENKINLLNC